MSAIENRLQRISALLNDPEIETRLQTVACNAVSAAVKRRVFRDGGNTDGGQIGEYSTKPIYVGDVLGVTKFKKAGKSGSNKKADGSAYKTGYFAGGYKEFRGAVGRQSEKIDLNLSGATFKAHGVGTKDGRIVFGILTQSAVDIIEGNEAKRGALISTPTIEEAAKGSEAVRKEIEALLA